MADKRGRPPLYDFDEFAGVLFDALVENPGGLTIHNIREMLGNPPRWVGYRTVTRLRYICGDDETSNVVIVRDGPRHLYKLTGSREEARPWLHRRGSYALAMLRSESAVLGSLVSGTDGRSSEGRRVRQMERTVLRLREDMAMFLEEVNDS